MKQRRQNTGNHPDPLAEFAAVETVYVCSNSRCGAAWNADPHGHCPMCIGPQGHGWSTEARVVFALPASDEPALCFALGCRDLTGAIDASGTCPLCHAIPGEKCLAPKEAP